MQSLGNGSTFSPGRSKVGGQLFLSAGFTKTKENWEYNMQM